MDTNSVLFLFFFYCFVRVIEFLFSNLNLIKVIKKVIKIFFYKFLKNSLESDPRTGILKKGGILGK